MGASYYGYSADITVSFPVNGKFTNKQKIVYTAVLNARNAVLKNIKPGVLWSDLHRLAHEEVLNCLKENGLLKGSLSQMLEDGLGSIFQPHGLGHLLGIDVHDVGGYTTSTPERLTKSGYMGLRTARKLETGMVLTVEPGCYFIDKCLDSALEDNKLKDYLCPEVINEFRGIGGVRIEDGIVVTEDGHENLTDVPRTIEEIEEAMNCNQRESWDMSFWNQLKGFANTGDGIKKRPCHC